MADLQDESTWLEWRSLIPAASHVTELVTTEDTRREFLEGARLLRLDRKKLGVPSPIQLVIADMLNAGRKFNGILEPRRTTKTTAVQAVILGRCSLREDFLAGWTMTKRDGGQKTGERFRKDVVDQLVRLYPDKDSRPFIVNTGKGTEHIRWPATGSWFNAYAPGNDAFTSGAYDIAWVDEGQDAPPDLGADLMTSIPPTLDGRDHPQMIVSGTAPAFRKGNLLWDVLHMPGAGVIRHGVPDDVDPDELLAWEPTEEHPAARVRELIELHHPGIGYTTPLSDVADNFEAMKATPGAFNTEYLGLAGEEGANTTLIPAPLWKSRKRTAAELATVEMPSLMAVALAVHPDGRWASIAAAWWGKRKGERHAALIHHQQGVEGLGNVILTMYRKHNRRIVYDGRSSSEGIEIAPLIVARPPIQARHLTTSDIGKATVLTLKLLKEGDLWVYEQPPLDDAVDIAVKRKLGESGSFAFGRPDIRSRPDDDITPIEALSRAIYALDDEIKTSSLSGVFGGV
ncbi:hypothetical protein [uncultured Microbacterium sp.]|uniref:hypothetical protein n=1 Tax=uncultured Microbacterium sp. TaxID=191216 RepID=UPI0025D1896D|nr:hypothetical protein [uncultured Microbacterium sp.]